MSFSSIWALVGEKWMKYVKFIPGQSSVDFSYRNPTLPFLTSDGLGAFLEESWSTLDQMMDITSKCWCWPKILKFDCMWATVDFWPSIVDFQAFEQLTEQTSCARHETWHGWSWGYIRTMETIWDPWEPSWWGVKP